MVAQSKCSTGAVPQFVLMVGNPGSGKSTILNGLVGMLKFKSGVSIGKGCTSSLQQESHEGVVYMDTPGLDDLKMREQAASAISEALKQNGNYKIFFVVTVEAGRVTPADCTTIECVLKAAPEIGSQFGVIVNKLAKPTADLFRTNKEAADELKAFLFHGVQSTVFMHYCQLDLDLHDMNNVVKPLPDALRDFINNMPPIEIHADQVTDVEVRDYAKLQASIEEQRAAMDANNALLQEKLIKQQEEHAAQMKALAAKSSKSSGGLTVGLPGVFSVHVPF